MDCFITAIIVITCIVAIIAIFILFLKVVTGWDRSPTCLVGKTAMVTGANTGLGYYTAQDFAKRGARVILACRDPQRAEEAREKIVQATGNPNVIVRIVDLGSLDSVRKFAKEIIATEERLDILVNNAGAAGFDHKITKDGLSLSMQVNHFGPFLLTLLLIGLLKKSAPSRIVHVSSCASHVANLNLNDLNAPLQGMLLKLGDYANNKLCNILFTNELARKLRGSGVDVNAVHPGGVQRDLFSNLSCFYRLCYEIVKPFYKSAKEGAQTSIYVAVSKDIEGESELYYTDCRRCWMPRDQQKDSFCKL